MVVVVRGRREYWKAAACSNTGSAEGRSQFQGEGEELGLTESMLPTLKSSWIHFLYLPHPGRPQVQKSELLSTSSLIKSIPSTSTSYLLPLSWFSPLLP